MKNIIIFLIFLLSGSISFSETFDLSVYVAGGMKSTFEKIKTEYLKKNNNVRFQVFYGSSGKGFFQIKNGAKYDIFVSADEKYPEEIFAEKLAKRRSEIYAVGTMAVIFNKKGYNSLKDLEKLNKIAIANPKVAPYGKGAIEIMERSGIKNNLDGKIIVGENLIQVIQFVETGNADAGFIAYPLISGLKEFEGRYIYIDESLYSPIKHAMILTVFGENKVDAIKFYDFLKSSTVKDILKKDGFKTE